MIACYLIQTRDEVTFCYVNPRGPAPPVPFAGGRQKCFVFVRCFLFLLICSVILLWCWTSYSYDKRCHLSIVKWSYRTLHLPTASTQPFILLKLRVSSFNHLSLSYIAVIFVLFHSCLLSHSLIISSSCLLISFPPCSWNNRQEALYFNQIVSFKCNSLPSEWYNVTNATKCNCMSGGKHRPCLKLEY